MADLMIPDALANRLRDLAQLQFLADAPSVLQYTLTFKYHEAA